MSQAWIRMAEKLRRILGMTGKDRLLTAINKSRVQEKPNHSFVPHALLCLMKGIFSYRQRICSTRELDILPCLVNFPLHFAAETSAL